jgi:hypothetical protein
LAPQAAIPPAPPKPAQLIPEERLQLDLDRAELQSNHPFLLEQDRMEAQDRIFEAQERAIEAQERALRDLNENHPVMRALKTPIPLPATPFSSDKLDRELELAQRGIEMAERAANLTWNHPVMLAQARGFGQKGRDVERVYDAGTRALDDRRYDEALEDFSQVAARAGANADGALYWKAYALNKLGRRDDALAALAELQKSYASSRWLDDAKALELQVKQSSGRPVSPEAESDEELKLLAINGLMQSDPDRAFPYLESLFKSSQSPKLKRNALFLLANSNAPRAQQMIEQIARGQANPDLQVLAIRYLGERRRTNSAQLLAEIYASSNDLGVKRSVLNALRSMRDKDRLLQIAKSEKSQDLRLEAIRTFAESGGTQAEVWQIYQAESSPEAKLQILQTLPQTGNVDRLLEIARAEKDTKLRRAAIQYLGGQRAASTGDALAAMYASEQDPEVKRAIVDSLSSQHNAKALIATAQKENDLKVKQRILERLIALHSPEANDYLMEILKK